jgi:CDP-6-deoxy-D-xylo-4-hexulose-3-dehydrase
MEGGLIATDDEELYQTLKSIRAHGWTRELPAKNHVYDKSGSSWDDLFRFVLPGYNLRPLEIEASIGRIQLQKLPQFISSRKKNALLFKEVTRSLQFIKTQIEHGESSWFGFSLLLEGKLKGKRSTLVELLDSSEIESRPIVTGNFTRNPVIKHLKHSPIGKLPGADAAHDDGLFVGNHHYDLSGEIYRLGEVLSLFEKSN